MAQTGDVEHGNKKGFNSEGLVGGSVPDLNKFNDVKHVRGTCSMARSSSPNSANSQFFFVSNQPYLTLMYCLGSGDRWYGICG